MPLPIIRSEKHHQKPKWLKVKAPGSPEYMQTRAIVRAHKLHTVCEEAMCPNIGECWSHATATFLIMGDLCTRRCHFCAVKKGMPSTLMPLDKQEPEHVGKAVAELQLQHAVITSVNRDDLPDGGASHFAATVNAIHHYAPNCRVELLIPDFQGSIEHLKVVMDCRIEILNHNLETISRLYKKVRPNADYFQSLKILKTAKEFDPSVKTKSGIMVGLGETYDEVLEVMDHMRAHKVDIITIGQYLRPSEKQIPIHTFVTPEEFEAFREAAIKRGFAFVESGPFVRSSYHAWKHSAIK
ncbi:MAG: lipoyl synthase [SAR324 cluster bacterium]|uniref:Lipoyl synthase n=1 Tax=SAR324 cluster bacterium TaxID=2024889 RepID=A0A7X9FPE4_9DELT|nr:lipoyl synthase [SAR324 cluster bacterium]